jgi:hypothetical protein
MLGKTGRGSPIRSGDGEVAMGGCVEEVVGVGWAPMTDSVCRELPELEGRRGKRTSTRPRRRNVRGAMSSPWRGKSTVTAAREVARSGGGAATGMDQRPRGRGCSWCAMKGDGGGKNGARWHRVKLDLNGAARSRGRGSRVGVRVEAGEERRGVGRGGGRLGRPAGAGGTVAARTGEAGADRWAAATVSGGSTG